MIWAQIHSGRKLHLAFEACEGRDRASLMPAGYISAPLCRTPAFNGNYRMTINVPLGNACRNCCRIARALQEQEK